MIEEKARDLGRLVGQSAEYQALRRAESDLKNDEEAQNRLTRIQELARQVDQAVASGQLPDQVVTEGYETAVRELELSSVGQRYVVARSNFEKLMAKVNAEISVGIEKGATSSIITL